MSCSVCAYILIYIIFQYFVRKRCTLFHSLERRNCMNIYDISKMTGVSTATVSRVINGSSNVSAKTREKVLSVIKEQGYTPNVFARGLGLNTMKTIGIMCTDSSDRYIAHAVYFLEESLRKQNYDMILCCTGYEHKEKEKQMSMLLSKRVDAVILVGSSYAEENDDLNSYITDAAKTVPVMMVNGVINSPNVYSVVCDDYLAMYDCTRQMLLSGRKCPLYIYNSLSYSGKKKMKGFKDAAGELGVTDLESKMLYIPSHSTLSRRLSPSYIRSMIGEVFKKRSGYDSVICSEDVLAVGVLKYASSAGLSVPKDLAVTGYNDSDLCECCEPELTSVDNRLQAICEKCVSSLMVIFEGSKAVPKQTVFSCELIQRSTTDFH